MALLKEQYAESKEGTSAVLLQSGLDDKWWADSTECYCYLRHVTDLLSEENKTYELRFCEPFIGQVILSGLVQWSNISQHLPKTSRVFTNWRRKFFPKGLITPEDGEKIIFRFADGKTQLFAGDQVLRTSTSLQDPLEGALGDWSQERPARGGALLGESDGSQPVRLLSRLKSSC